MIPLNELDKDGVMPKKTYCLDYSQSYKLGRNKIISQNDKLCIFIDTTELAKEIHFKEGINSKPELKDKAWEICRNKLEYIDKANHLKSTIKQWAKIGIIK